MEGRTEKNFFVQDRLPKIVVKSGGGRSRGRVGQWEIWAGFQCGEHSPTNPEVGKRRNAGAAPLFIDRSFSQKRGF